MNWHITVKFENGHIFSTDLEADTSEEAYKTGSTVARIMHVGFGKIRSVLVQEIL